MTAGGTDPACQVARGDLVYLVGDPPEGMQQPDGKEIAPDDAAEDASDEAQRKHQAQVTQLFIPGLVIGSGNDHETGGLVVIVISDGVLFPLRKIDAFLAVPRSVQDRLVGTQRVGGRIAVPVDPFVEIVVSLDHLVFHGDRGGGVYLPDQRLIEDAALAQQAARRYGPVGQTGLDVLDAVRVGKIINRGADERQYAHHEQGEQQRYTRSYRHQPDIVFRIYPMPTWVWISFCSKSLS